MQPEARCAARYEARLARLSGLYDRSMQALEAMLPLALIGASACDASAAGAVAKIRATELGELARSGRLYVEKRALLTTARRGGYKRQARGARAQVPPARAVRVATGSQRDRLTP